MSTNSLHGFHRHIKIQPKFDDLFLTLPWLVHWLKQGRYPNWSTETWTGGSRSRLFGHVAESSAQLRKAPIAHHCDRDWSKMLKSYFHFQSRNENDKSTAMAFLWPTLVILCLSAPRPFHCSPFCSRCWGLFPSPLICTALSGKVSVQQAAARQRLAKSGQETWAVANQHKKQFKNADGSKVDCWFNPSKSALSTGAQHIRGNFRQVEGSSRKIKKSPLCVFETWHCCGPCSTQGSNDSTQARCSLTCHEGNLRSPTNEDLGQSHIDSREAHVQAQAPDHGKW